jgi:hypothetical protein
MTKFAAKLALQERFVEYTSLAETIRNNPVNPV